MEAITQAIKWIETDRRETRHAAIVTDSLSVLRKIETGKLRSEWLKSIAATAVHTLTWIFCPGHAGVQGNEVADSLAGAAETEFDMKEDRGDILRKLSDQLKEREENEWLDNASITRMKEMDVKRGSGRKCQLTGKARRTSNQLMTGIISETTLRVVLERGTEHLWVCPECMDVVLLDKV